jgi:hypothetical protein
MRRRTQISVCLLGLTALGCLAPCQAEENLSRSKRLWLVSVAATLAANALDVASSRNGVEANPLLQSPNGSYNMTRGILLKAGLSAGTIMGGLLILRHSPHQAKGLAIVNFGTAAALTGVAVHNWRLPASPSQ